MPPIIAAWVDADVYVENDWQGSYLIKIYGDRLVHPVKEEGVHQYTLLQNLFANERLSIVLPQLLIFWNNTIKRITFSVLKLTWEVISWRREASSKWLRIVRVKERYVSWPNLKSLKLKEASEIIREVVMIGIRWKISNYQLQDITDDNIKIESVKNGELSLIVTDIGANITRLLKKNKELVETLMIWK